jgi:hypothetical protein
VNQQRCKSCDTAHTLDPKGYCKICAPYRGREEFYPENLTTWAWEMMGLERESLDDIKPLSPPENDAQWIQVIQQVTPKEYQSSAHAIHPDCLTDEVGAMWHRVLTGEPFTVDRTTRSSMWMRNYPVSLQVIQKLAEILMGLQGQEPLWRLRAGIIAYGVNWRDYVYPDWKPPRQRSFRYLRHVADSTHKILPTSEGLVILGSSGAQYLIGGEWGHPTVLNYPDGSGGILQRHVCISAQGSDPLGDRIASLALGLVNDIETAKRIGGQLRQIVDQFDNQKTPEVLRWC